MYTTTKFIRDTPETPIEDYVRAEQGIERLRDGFAAYFSGTTR